MFGNPLTAGYLLDDGAWPDPMPRPCGSTTRFQTPGEQAPKPVQASPGHANRKPVVGLIGTMGAGKSTVARRLRQLGARVIDADRVGHELLGQPAVIEQLVGIFGLDVLGPDGAVDRRRLARRAFADPAERRQLERLLHPMMRQVFHDRIEHAQRDPAVGLVVLDAAILLEAGWDDLCDQVLLVTAAPDLRRVRLRRTRDWTEAELDAREQAQWPLPDKCARADFVVSNDGSLEECSEQVDRWFQKCVPPGYHPQDDLVKE